MAAWPGSRSERSRYGSAGNKDDAFDVYVLADTLRTDRPRLRPSTRNSDATVTLRMTVRARQDLVAARVAMANQLRAHLQTTLPHSASDPRRSVRIDRGSAGLWMRPGNGSTEDP